MEFCLLHSNQHKSYKWQKTTPTVSTNNPPKFVDLVHSRHHHLVELVLAIIMGCSCKTAHLALNNNHSLLIKFDALNQVWWSGGWCIVFSANYEKVYGPLWLIYIYLCNQYCILKLWAWILLMVTVYLIHRCGTLNWIQYTNPHFIKLDWLWVRKIVGLNPGQVKSKSMKLVFVAFRSKNKELLASE
jgi:hypothetical protein